MDSKMPSGGRRFYHICPGEVADFTTSVPKCMPFFAKAPPAGDRKESISPGNILSLRITALGSRPSP